MFSRILLSGTRNTNHIYCAYPNLVFFWVPKIQNILFSYSSQSHFASEHNLYIIFFMNKCSSTKTILFWRFKKHWRSSSSWLFAFIFHLPSVHRPIYRRERMNVFKRIRKKYRLDLLLADIVFDVFSEDGSQGSAGGDGEYLFLYIFFYICYIFEKRSNISIAKSESKRDSY